MRKDILELIDEAINNPGENLESLLKKAREEIVRLRKEVDRWMGPPPYYW